VFSSLLFWLVLSCFVLSCLVLSIVYACLVFLLSCLVLSCLLLSFVMMALWWSCVFSVLCLILFFYFWWNVCAVQVGSALVGINAVSVALIPYSGYPPILSYLISSYLTLSYLICSDPPYQIWFDLIFSILSSSPYPNLYPFPEPKFKLKPKTKPKHKHKPKPRTPNPQTPTLSSSRVLSCFDHILSCPPLTNFNRCRRPITNFDRC
jgi:hypothetical protein